MNMRTPLRPCGHNRVFISMLILFSLSTSGAPVFAEKSPYEWALVQLDYIRKEKTDQLTRYITKLHRGARQARKDKTVTAFFEMNRLYFDACRSQKPLPSLTRKIEEMRQHFNTYYIQNYLEFYDMLFVDINGSVFYTLRKEGDTCLDLIHGKAAIGPLQETIRTLPDREVFIDYHEYPPSSEPAAFFIEPVTAKGKHVGWLALQCPINKLNSIFSATDDLRHTGETFLVNQDGLMLTESYFKGQSTILNKRLNDRNVNVKFAEKKGHRVVTDYRGATALTSFEVFDFMNTHWLVVAKIDKDEITTQHYQRHKRYYFDQMMQWLKRQSAIHGFVNTGLTDHSRIIRIDMDEFARGQDNDRLETWGVSTCTALLSMIPGEFAYLAHISPQDKVYGQSGTDLLSQVTRKIKNFEIYPYEKRKVQFAVIAPHFDGLANIINQLIHEGFMLSQIQIGYYPDAGSAAVQYDCRTNSLNLSWSFDQGNHARTPVHQDMSGLVRAGSVIEKIMAMDKEKTCN